MLRFYCSNSLTINQPSFPLPNYFILPSLLSLSKSSFLPQHQFPFSIARAIRPKLAQVPLEASKPHFSPLRFPTWNFPFASLAIPSDHEGIFLFFLKKHLSLLPSIMHFSSGAQCQKTLLLMLTGCATVSDRGQN